MKIKKRMTSVVSLLCLLCLMVGLFAGCGSGSKIEVVFDMNWKDAVSVPESMEVRKGKPYGELPTIAEDARKGYTFGGWYLDSDCDGEEVTADTIVTTGVSHVLYAKWIGHDVTVSFDLQGGTINGVSNVEEVVVKVGNVYSMMAIPDDPEKENCSFMGWFYDPEGTEGPVLTSTKVEKTEDHTLYAVWQEYQLFYDFENGTGLETFAAAGNIQYGIERYNGSDQLKITNPGTDKADGTALQMWIPLKSGTRVMMDLSFDGELPAENARMYMFGYGINSSGIAITDGVLDITQSETHRKWYHGNGYRAMQKNGAWYYGDEGNWHEGNTCRFEMIVMEDCAGLYLTFCLGSELEPAQFAKNSIYIDNIAFTPNYYRVLGEGMMGSSPHGATDKGIYFAMTKNDMPYNSDWQIYYDATSADNVKVIRNGKVYRIAQTNCDNIVKFSETDYYLRLEEYTIGPAAPISNKDIFIVEGDFRYGSNVITIQKTYIYHDGISWVFADQLPAELAPASEQTYNFPDPYYGILRPHEGGATDSGIHFKLSDNGLPFGKDWDVYYDATTADNIKIIRDGKVYRAAQVGCDNICKFGKADYYLRLEAYTIGGYWPFTTEDIFIIEGKFQYEKSVLDINKTYIYHNGSDWVFTTKLPAELAPESEEPVEPEEIADGVMGSSPNGATDQGIYFTMKDNGLPYGDWNVYYDATSAENIQIIRNGTAYSAAVVGCDNICKFSATDYYLRLENYTIGGYAPFSTEDVFVVEGDFTYEDSTLTIVKTYIYHNGTSWVFASELPEDLKPGEGGEVQGNNLGVLSQHVNGVNMDSTTNSVKGIYATGAATTAPFNTDWSVEYTPAAAKNYQLIRDGVTYDVGVPGSGTIVLFGQKELYLKQEGHTVGDGTLLPIRDGDILVVKGEWICNQDASASITVTKTCILISEGTATFYAGEPDEEGGEGTDSENSWLYTHVYGVNVDTTTNSIKGIYAMCQDNEATYNTDWSVEYTPAEAKNYQLIRDGVTYDVGVCGNGTIVLFGQTELYLKQEGHTVGDGSLLPIRDGDILVVQGQWNCIQDPGAALNMDKTYILISGNTAVFSAELPGGELPDDDEPADVQWPFNFDNGTVSTDVFKLRDSDLDMTVEELGSSLQLRLQPTVANGKHWLWLAQDLKAGTVITMDVTFQRKLGTMSLYLYGAKENGDPITEGTVSETVPQQWFDGQGVAADFTGGNTNTQTLTFTVYEDCHGIAFMLGYGNKKPNVIYLDNIAKKDASPEDENALGVLADHYAGVNLDPSDIITGIYATVNATGAAYNTDWSVEYTPALAGNYKLIRDGVTYDVGVVGNGTIVLFGQTDLYLKQEGHTVGDGTLLPIREGDVLVVEGQWFCTKDSDMMITISKTYILVEDGKVKFSSEQP